MRVFFVELHTLAVSIIGGTTPRRSTGNNAKCYAQNAVRNGSPRLREPIPLAGAFAQQNLRRTDKLLWF